jgi:hypothetical protein
MDLLTSLPLTEKGNKHLVAFQCSFTKYVFAVALPDKTATSVAEAFVEHVILPHGIPTEILSDNGTEFANELMSKLCELLDITRKTCNPYMASTDGQIERFFSTYSNLMSTIVNSNQNNWDRLTPFVLHAYNNTEHTSTGFTPTYLAFGREIPIPFDVCVPVASTFTYNDNKDYFDIVKESLTNAWKIARDNIDSAQCAYKFYHDLNVKGHSYQQNDIVYVFVPQTQKGHVRKFSRQYQGPYVITKLKGLNAYVKAIDTRGEPCGVEFVVHLQRLKKAQMPTEIKQQAKYVSRQTTDITPKSTKPKPKPRSPAVSNPHPYNLRSRSK